MSQIIPIVSEALQATVRRLLPSQNGFGEDLQASNVIIPVVDLTPSAEGTELRSDLQRALDFTTTHKRVTTSDNDVGSTGFNFLYFSTFNTSGTTNRSIEIKISTGLTSNTIWKCTVSAGNQPQSQFISPILTIFVPAAYTLSVVPESDLVTDVTTRQIADVSGVLVDPNGYTPQ